MNKIINATQHPATLEQIEAGVEDLSPAQRVEIQNLLTFDELPQGDALRLRAISVVSLIERSLNEIEERDYEKLEVMIGGAPFFMEPLACRLRKRGFVPVYAFSKRVSVEQAQPDGTVKKVSAFKHVGFVTD